MISAVHIEDEPRNVSLLQTLIDSYFATELEIVGSAGNIEDAFQLIRQTKPQLVFLDIELEHGNAFELLEKIQNSYGIQFEIIFITAFDEYAVKAFRQNALDYLLKPISTKEFQQAIEKAVNRIKSNGSYENVLNLLKELKPPALASKIGLPVKDSIQFVSVDNIVKIEAKGNYVIAYLNSGQKVNAIKTLGDIEELLPPSQFIRVHNSWIIHLKYIKKYFRGKNGYIQLDDDTIVPVSIRKKGDFLDIIEL
jgi:two-component system, LytTR family, response regulator